MHHVSCLTAACPAAMWRRSARRGCKLQRTVLLTFRDGWFSLAQPCSSKWILSGTALLCSLKRRRPREDVPDLPCTLKYLQHTVAPGTLANLVLAEHLCATTLEPLWLFTVDCNGEKLYPQCIETCMNIYYEVTTTCLDPDSSAERLIHFNSKSDLLVEMIGEKKLHFIPKREICLLFSLKINK